jgi:ribosomal protein S18 acetylase RimI-like enzyme
MSGLRPVRGDNGVTITPEPLAGCVAETLALQRATWGETFAQLGDGELSADMRYRIELERNGNYVFVSLRSSGAMVGMCAFYIRFARLTQRRYASNDVIYVQPEFRRGGNARALWCCAVCELFKRGVTDIRIDLPVNAKASFFRAMGMVPRSQRLWRAYSEQEVRDALSA